MHVHERRQKEQLESALAATQRFASETLDALSKHIAVLDQQFRILTVNRAWREFSRLNGGNPAHTCEGVNYLEVCQRAAARGDRLAAKAVALLREVACGKRSHADLEYACHSPTEQRWFVLHIARFSGPPPLRLVASHENITKRKLAERQIRFQATMLASVQQAVIASDMQGRLTFWNPYAETMYGWAAHEVLGKDVMDVISAPASRQEAQALMGRLRSGASFDGELLVRNRDGREFIAAGVISPIRDEDGALIGLVGVSGDQTGRKSASQKLAEETIWRQANFDSLTGLPNRSMFHERLAQEMQRAARHGEELALMFIDLDHFKEINDTLGHDVGDLLLKEAARRLAHCVRRGDTVARLGGDEFTVILTELHEEASVERVAQNILRRCGEPFHLGAETLHISASVGITMFPRDATGIDALLKNADQAMYAAKALGRDRFSYFTPSMQRTAQNRMRMANDLRRALAEQQFCLLYQPIVELASRRICKAEALLRWRHPERGVISPSQFVAIAEETGLIGGIGEWVLSEAARQAGHWRESLHPEFQVSVNISPAQFRRHGLTATDWMAQLVALGACATAGDGKAGKISLEITESMLLETSISITEQLLQLRQAGTQVAIDDFGTGYSSLSYLKKFHIDYLKIDQSFVRKMNAGSDDLALCQAIIVLGHTLGIRIIAEGVETREQCELLSSAGCDFGQGFLFSPPCEAAQLELLVRMQPDP